jgi:NAD(P)-dependent dehydrogenase (short-subunit alcohol dehydrogenase family)
MQIDLSGKSAIVTGSTAGIGLAIAKGLAGAGARVVVNGRTQIAVERAIAEVKTDSDNDEVTGFTGDLAIRETCDALIQAYSDCDVLINNLGIFAQQDVFEIPDSEWFRFFEVNVMSGVRLARAYLPGMIERGWGRVVFISSESALNIPADMLHYGMTKTAQLAIARAWPNGWPAAA